jgi:hypothetical protein
MLVARTQAARLLRSDKAASSASARAMKALAAAGVAAGARADWAD